jgi:hypothetical protein
MQTLATIVMALILTATIAYCAVKALEKLDSDDPSDDSNTDVSQADITQTQLLTKSQKEKAMRNKLSSWHCNRIHNKENHKAHDDQTIDKANRVPQEEQTHNKLSRPGSTWRPRQLRGEA